MYRYVRFDVSFAYSPITHPPPDTASPIAVSTTDTVPEPAQMMPDLPHLHSLPHSLFDWLSHLRFHLRSHLLCRMPCSVVVVCRVGEVVYGCGDGPRVRCSCGCRHRPSGCIRVDGFGRVRFRGGG